MGWQENIVARSQQRSRRGRPATATLIRGLALTGGCLGLLFSQQVRAAEPTYDPRTTYGDIGILDMPSARMAPDGDLSATIGVMKSTQRYNFAFQMLPWLEGSFRYSRLADTRGLKALYDRSFGLKIRLETEDEYWPEISLGMRDVLGTGVYGAEYVVASKRFGDFDVTAGLGWGRLASVDTFPNPFGLVIPSFKNRPGFAGGTGGTVNFGQLFHGPSMGLFGGVVWHSPIENLDVLLEYSSDRYVEEAAGGKFKVRMPVNAGLSYRVAGVATISAGWFYGSSYGLTLGIDTDPTVPLSPQRIGPEIGQPVIRPVKQQIDALASLLSGSRLSNPGRATLPWVQLPNTQESPDALALTSALMSIGGGVRDVDVTGDTLVVDTHWPQSASRQCDRYAGIVAQVEPKLRTIALTDMDDPSGRVAICGIAHAAAFPGKDDNEAGTGDDVFPPDVDPGASDRRIRAAVSAQALQVEALSVEPDVVWLYFSNRRYASEAEAAGRIARILMAEAPSKVEIFHIISVRNGIELRDFEIARSALERATVAYGTSRELGEAISVHTAPLSNPVLDRSTDSSYPRLHWSIGPGFRQGLFDPQRPLQIQFFAAANASVDITPKITIEGTAEANIYNTYDLNQISNSLLPHVRSDVAKYFKDGSNGIAKLDAFYRTRLTRDVYFEAKAGYLEDMFAGGGVQALWRPEGERFAFGVDMYQVWQRDFNRLFGLQNYHVFTGHVTAYYESPWDGLNFAVHAGRFLAGDYGASIEVTRRFSTGVEVGAFATFTNVPFSRFGEGSFDKGIVIHIPLEWALPFYSQSSYTLLLRSLTRDGGQRLDYDDSLFDETRPSSYGEVLGHLDEIVAP
ncbi:MAG: YjbH domain-containing protein [Rhizomicrobium sp.]